MMKSSEMFRRCGQDQGFASQPSQISEEVSCTLLGVGSRCHELTNDHLCIGESFSDNLERLPPCDLSLAKHQDK